MYLIVRYPRNNAIYVLFGVWPIQIKPNFEHAILREYGVIRKLSRLKTTPFSLCVKMMANHHPGSKKPQIHVYFRKHVSL